MIENKDFPPTLGKHFGILQSNKANTRLYANKVGNIYRCVYVSTFLETEVGICDSFEKWAKRRPNSAVYIKAKPKQYKPKRPTMANKQVS